MPSLHYLMSAQTENDTKDTLVNALTYMDICPVSAFERHLLTLSDVNRHHFFDYLSPNCLCLLSRTSTLVFHLVKFYERHAWRLPEFLRPWLPHPRSFLRLLDATCTVISGSQALYFMDRRPPDITSDLDLFVHVDAVHAVGNLLLRLGYQYGKRPVDEEPYFDFYDRVDLLFKNEERIRTCGDNKSIVDVIDFWQKKRHFHSTVIMKVQLIVVAVDPIRFILFRFHSSESNNVTFFKCH
jgi:hypothetical protein